MARTQSFQSKSRVHGSNGILLLRSGVFLLLLIILLVVSPVHLLGQQIGIREGNRVKLDVPSMSNNKFVGIVSELSDSTLVLRSGYYTYMIPFESIDKVSVSAGKRRHVGRGAALGLLGGAALGGMIGFISYEPCTEEGFMACFLRPESSTDAAMMGSILGIVPGTLIGMLIGLRKTDHWEKIPNEMLFKMEPVGVLQPEMHPQLTLRWTFGSR